MLIKILKSPITLFTSMFLGILIGLYVKWLVPFLSIVNQVYLSLLQVCVIPIVSCAIIINIGLLFQKQLRPILTKWIIGILIAMLFASSLGISLTLLTRNFVAPDAETMSIISKMGDTGAEQKTTDSFIELAYYEKNEITTINKNSLSDFIIDAIPSNIFTALNDNKIIQIVIFSCILGIMLEFTGKKRSKPIMMIATGFYEALCKFIDYLLIFLPICLCSMLAEQFSNEGFISLLGSLVKYIGVNYLALLIIIIVSFVIIQTSAKCSFKEHILAVKRTLFISIATSSCIASTPTLIEDIPEPMRLDKNFVQSIAPIGIIICQTGTIVSASILEIYSTIIYNVPINFNTIFVILVGSIVFSISITGVPGIVATSMLSIMLQPIGIPSETMAIIFLSTVPFYQGVNVFSSVYGNIALTSFALPHKTN